MNKDILREDYSRYGLALKLFSPHGFLILYFRLDDAIQILEQVVSTREEKLGTANPGVDDEKRRLGELLKEAGRVRSKKVRSLENLLDGNSRTVNNLVIEA